MADELKTLITTNGVFEPLDLEPNELINFLRFMNDDDRAKHLIEVYDSLSARARSNLDLDRLADKAGYSKKEVRAIIISALVEYDIECSQLLLSRSKPAVVKKVIKSALGDGPDSFNSMQLMMEYYGYWLPNRKR